MTAFLPKNVHRVTSINIQELTQLNQTSRSTETELLLAEARLQFAKDATERSPIEAWTARSTSPFVVPSTEIPEITRQELSVENIAGGVHHHGAVIVRNLFSSALAQQYREQIDSVFEEQALFDREPEADRQWFNPPAGLTGHPLCQAVHLRKQTGSMWALNSPRVVYNLLEEYERLGLKELCEHYFGEPALLSVKKWVLRRIEPLTRAADWHQDGAFMGSGVKSLNLWVSLSECGGNATAPGLDIMPGRFNSIVETGTEGASFTWSVGEKAASDAANNQMPLTPTFNPGDAVFFDHFNLHRTSFSPSFIDTRYAIECWFLGESEYPEKQVPLLW